VHRDVAALRAALERAENERVRLDVANGAWGQEGMAFEQPFLDVLDRRYAGAFHRTPFDADPEAARVGINRWISERTAARIPELFGRGDITRLTRLVLANAIYLRADWQTPFDQRNTGDARFHRLDGPPVSVRMMRRRGEIRWATGGDWEAVELPYVGDRLAMLVVAPRRGRFRRVERRLGARFVRGVVRRLRKSDLLLGLPKFELRTEIELTRPLGALGVRDAFDPERADFGRMTKADRLRISRVRQEVFLRVDEKGTEAAAATGIVFERVSRPPSITVDRPFLFALRDRRTGAVLFLGRVLRPQASTK
jgi:serpin B